VQSRNSCRPYYIPLGVLCNAEHENETMSNASAIIRTPETLLKPEGGPSVAGRLAQNRDGTVGCRRGCRERVAVSMSRTDELNGARMWSAVGSMSMCVALLIAAEFMPVSLLTPIADDLRTTAGAAGQAISVSGVVAVVTSLCIATLTARFDRRPILIGLTFVMLCSLVLTAAAPNYAWLLVARSLLGIVIGGFWSLATATVMRLVPEQVLPKALGVVFMGNAVATAFAAPIGSYLGGLVGWRGVFWAFIPIVLMNIAWQWFSLPSMRPASASSIRGLCMLLRRRHVGFGILGVMLMFAGAFSAFTYLRPFLETRTGVTVTQLSLLLLGLGAAGFVGTYGASALAGRHLHRLLIGLPVALGGVTLCLLMVQQSILAVSLVLIAWGTLNSAVPVAWSTWLTKSMSDEPEGGGSLMVAATQLSIMLGAAAGGLLLDHLSITATFVGGAALLFAAGAVGAGRRFQPDAALGLQQWTNSESPRTHRQPRAEQTADLDQKGAIT
jgi:predicted MFS family arabinose efflux permease